MDKKRGTNRTNKDLQLQVLRKTAHDTTATNSRAVIDMNKPLTEKQRDFVKFWAAGESIMTASVKAGYNDGGTIGYRLARDPRILEIYKAEKLKYEEACAMTRKRVMDGFLDAIEMAKLMAEPASMVAGWREIAKMCGYYEPVKVQISRGAEEETLYKRLNSMTDADLLKAIAEGAKNGEQVPLLERVDSPAR